MARNLIRHTSCSTHAGDETAAARNARAILDAKARKRAARAADRAPTPGITPPPMPRIVRPPVGIDPPSTGIPLSAS